MSEEVLKRKLAEVLSMTVEKVEGTAFIKLLEKMVSKYEQERKDRYDRDLRHFVELVNVGDDEVMGFKEYQEMSKRTMPEKGKDAIVNYSMGLAGEAGEVVDMIKKVIFHNHLMNKLELKRELGDVLHYLSGLCTLYDLTLEEVAAANVVKLQKRYPKGFRVEDSVNRVEYGYFNGKPITKEQHEANCKMSINVDER